MRIARDGDVKVEEKSDGLEGTLDLAVKAH